MINTVPEYGQSKLNQSDVKKFLIYLLGELHESSGRLPSGALAKEDQLYMVEGREQGSGSNMGIGDRVFIVGNPIDIYGKSMEEGTFFGYNSEGHVKNNWYQHQKLTAMNEGTEIEEQAWVKYTFQKGVLVPSIDNKTIKPTVASPVEYLNPLKEKGSFMDAAAPLLGEKTGTIAAHLF